MADHPLDAEFVGETAPVGSPGHVGHRHFDLAVLRETVEKTISVFPVVRNYARIRVISDIEFLPEASSESLAISIVPLSSGREM